MKAKKQKLVKQVLKWVDESYIEKWTEQEVNDLVDEFIDYHDRKKKAKFGSDNEVVKNLKVGTVVNSLHGIHGGMGGVIISKSKADNWWSVYFTTTKQENLCHEDYLKIVPID